VSFGLINPTDCFPERDARGESYLYSFLIFIFLSLFIAVLASCAPPGQFHGQAPQSKTADQIIGEMRHWANLTDEQEVQIRPIVEEHARKRNELVRKHEKRDRNTAVSLEYGLRDLRRDAENQLQYFLTNKQMIEYGNMQQEEDQRIVGEKTQERRDPENPRDRGRR